MLERCSQRVSECVESEKATIYKSLRARNKKRAQDTEKRRCKDIRGGDWITGGQCNRNSKRVAQRVKETKRKE